MRLSNKHYIKEFVEQNVSKELQKDTIFLIKELFLNVWNKSSLKTIELLKKHLLDNFDIVEKYNYDNKINSFVKENKDIIINEIFINWMNVKRYYILDILYEYKIIDKLNIINNKYNSLFISENKEQTEKVYKIFLKFILDGNEINEFKFPKPIKSDNNLVTLNCNNVSYNTYSLNGLINVIKILIDDVKIDLPTPPSLHPSYIDDKLLNSLPTEELKDIIIDTRKKHSKKQERYSELTSLKNNINAFKNGNYSFNIIEDILSYLDENYTLEKPLIYV